LLRGPHILNRCLRRPQPMYNYGLLVQTCTDWPTVDTLVAAIKCGLSMYEYLHIRGFTTSKRYASACVAAKVSRDLDSTLNWRSIRVYTDVHNKPLGCSEVPLTRPYRSHEKNKLLLSVQISHIFQQLQTENSLFRSFERRIDAQPQPKYFHGMIGNRYSNMPASVYPLYYY